MKGIHHLTAILVAGTSLVSASLAPRQPWHAEREADTVSNLEQRQLWYAEREADTSSGVKKRQPWYAEREADTTPEKRQPWYAEHEADATSQAEKRQPWYAEREADTTPGVTKRQPWYAEREGDTAPGKRQPWYAEREADATPNVGKRQPWYAEREADTVAEHERRQPWYAEREADTEAGPEKRQLWYAEREQDAEANGDLEKRMSPPQEYGPDPRLWLNTPRMVSGPAIARAVQRKDPIALGSAQRRSILSAEQHEAEDQAIRDWVYHNMRVDPLSETSDRGRKLFEFQVKSATDRVDREHVPAHILPLFENAINEQQRVTYLNLYLQVTGRQPRSATELGWNATREEPTLLENDEVGYGYALASQHQHHCANILADAIDLGRDNINDFFLVPIVDCISLLNIYAEHLSEYREPVRTLTDLARGRLERGFGMAD